MDKVYLIEDFETENGVNAIHVNDLKKLLNYDKFEYGEPHRIYLILLMVTGARPSGIENITWFNFSNNILLYKPHKQMGRITRRVKMPPNVMKELNYFKKNNFFYKGKLFNFKYKALERMFNDKIRKDLGGNFLDWCPYQYSQTVRLKHQYTMRSIRTTIATLVFHYFTQTYGYSVALARTCMWLGHKSDRMTADHYIKNIHKVGIETLPELPMLDLMDHLVYSEDTQTKIITFDNRQTQLVETF